MSENVLTPKQLTAIRALLSTRTRAEAAAAAGVNPKTISRWLQQDDFRHELTRQQSDMIGEAARALVVMGIEARTALHEIVIDPAAKDGDRIRAAVSILLTGARWWELYNLDDAIRRLEEVRSENFTSED